INMVNMTLNIPETLYKRMKMYNEIKWSEVARKAFENRLDEFELLDDLKSIKKAERDKKLGKTTSLKNLIKELGFENEL
ncbi:MAG: hypothetical protein V1824_03395, partial [archaeon]